MQLWNRVLQSIRQSWWGILVSYLLVLGAVYLAIWNLIEPASLPDSFESLPSPFDKRIFYHLVASVLVASHLVLFALLWLRWKHRQFWRDVISGTPPADPARSTGESEPEERIRQQLLCAEEERDALRQRLVSYESLEQEILGLLSPGGNVALHDIAGYLRIADDPDAQRRVRLAVARLIEQRKIEGTGGNTPQLRYTVPL